MCHWGHFSTDLAALPLLDTRVEAEAVRFHEWENNGRCKLSYAVSHSDLNSWSGKVFMV